MASLTEMERKARKLCTHTIVFTDPTEQMIATRAMQGVTTRAIADEFGLTMSEAQYRVNKAQKSLGTRFRRDYRSGTGPIAKQMLHATEKIGLQVVAKQIAPQFVPYARQGVGRV